MTPTALIGYVLVPLLGSLMCLMPAITRPTVQFGVRVPPAHLGATVIRQARRTFYWRSAAVALCCATAAAVSWRSGSWWLPRVILLLELAADTGCVWLAHRKIIAIKTAEGWFAGLRQTVVADTGWRTQPQRFPIRWLIPAVTIIATTLVIGVVRYPQLPDQLTIGLGTSGARQVPTSPVSAFGMVFSQLFLTGVWTGLMALIYRSRPDIDPANPTASLSGYRRLLDGYARAALILLALVDLTFLLGALQRWQFYRLHGVAASLPALPAVSGVLLLIAVAMRAGRDRGAQHPDRAAAAGSDDDRFWKAGLVYVNPGDPAIMVAARIGVGWSFNLGNPFAWLIIAIIVATAVGLAVIRLAAGM